MAASEYEQYYEAYLEAISAPYGGKNSQAFQNALASGEITAEKADSMLSAAGYTFIKNNDGTYSYIGKPSIDPAASDNAVSVIDSNTQSGTSGMNNGFTTSEPFGTSGTGTGSGNVTSSSDNIRNYQNGTRQTGGENGTGVGSKILGVAGKALSIIMGYGVGLNLGKQIDAALYDADPDYWDEKGLETLDPDTWSQISANIDNPVGRFAFNMLAQVRTADDGNKSATLYADENAQAYFAKWLLEKGLFSETEKSISTGGKVNGVSIPSGFERKSGTTSLRHFKNFDFYPDGAVLSSGDYIGYVRTSKEGVEVRYILTKSDNVMHLIAAITDESATYAGVIFFSSDDYFGVNTSYSRYTYAGKTVRYYDIDVTKYSALVPVVDTSVDSGALAYYLWYGDFETTNESNLPGVSNQKDANVFDPSGLTADSSVADVLSKMKEQYPDLWNNRIEYDVVQPDGSTKTYTYIPLPIATGINEQNENQPVSDPTTVTTPQTQPQVSPTNATDTQIATLLKLLNQPLTQTGQPTQNPVPTGYVNPTTNPTTGTPTGIPTPPTNPPTTGTGDTPTVVMPTGHASSLWAIYNPTLEQINSFGSWLWSSDFIDQILKLFSDPMQAIIGIHKIYCTPTTGDTRTIKVGYLDSGVSSKIVTEQYTTVDCGSINLFEYFGNVFDYAPYTQLRLYLPFIGIVNLDTADAMRGVIHVVYHVDVLSGACLAEVQITRDAAGGTIYQFAGNAAVTMPISSGSYIGVIANVVGVASSAIGGFASGGVAGGIAGGVTGALTRRGGTQVEHSGNFSGNAGAMGIKKPYLIIERPQTALAANYAEYIGTPSNQTVVLSSCTGYIKVKEVHLENVPATGAELSEIEQNLKQGVIV